MRYFFTFLFIVSSNFIYSQVIVNTESSLSEFDSNGTAVIDVEADGRSGNVNIFELNTSLQLGLKKNKNLFRLIFGNEYVREDNEKVVNDLMGQFRYNFYYKDYDSFFSFIQLQKSFSLSLDQRFLLGGGWRKRISDKNSKGYFDFAFGAFYEKENYPSFENIPSFDKENLRLTLNIYNKIYLQDNLSIINTIYSQWKSSDLNDFRLFHESQLILNLKKFNIYISYELRRQNITYIPIEKNDSNYTLGFNFTL